MSNTTQTTDTQFRQASAEYNFGFLDEYAKKKFAAVSLKLLQYQVTKYLTLAVKCQWAVDLEPEVCS